MKKGELKKPVAKKPVINKKLHLSHKYLFFFFIAVFIIIISIPFLVWSGWWEEQYRVNYNDNREIVSTANYKTYIVTNNSNKDYLIPNRTSTEINSFAGHLPPNVTMTLKPNPPSPTLNCDNAGFVCGNNCTYHDELYGTVAIGNQCWFKEDLHTTTDYNSATIPLWAASTSISYYGLYDKYTKNFEGNPGYFLYQWAAALPEGGVEAGLGLPGQQGICPAGWRIPSDNDFIQFKNALLANNPSCQIDYCIPYNCYEGLISFAYQGSRTNSWPDREWWRVGSLHNVLTSTWDQSSNPHWAAKIMVFQNYSAVCETPSNNEQTAFSVRCIKDISGWAPIQ